jgi:excisionase family DNA binding protein
METTLLTSKEIAKIVRVHPITVRRWILKGKLSSVKIGGVRRISIGALLDFLEESSRRGKQKNPGGGNAA